MRKKSKFTIFKNLFLEILRILKFLTIFLLLTEEIIDIYKYKALSILDKYNCYAFKIMNS